MADTGYIEERSPEGVSLVVTGRWSAQADEVLKRGAADGLVLNYARGFCEPDLEFLDGAWALRRLDVLDRTIRDLSPIGRLADTLESLSVQAAPEAELELTALTHLEAIAGEWALLRGTLRDVEELQSVVTWRFGERNLHAFRDHLDLRQLTIKEAPSLEECSGLAALTELRKLGILLARSLRDISDVGELTSLVDLELEACRAIEAIDDVEALRSLKFLGLSDCGEIQSLRPVAALERLEVLHAWGDTCIIDGDLSPLARLPRLREIRMRARASYTPRLPDLLDALRTQASSAAE
ncbi:MAG: hypothetical protein M3065_08395 [Actinomycetota bacterium]|nr:hypothetical protein [Actinomycetota bacterium]